MLIRSDELHRLRGRVVMVDGAFDPLHDGHLAYFEAAAHLGPVLCNVTGDDYVATKHPPLLPHERRARLIDALRPIEYTHAGTSGTAAVLRELRPRVYAKGADWRGRLPEDQVALCRELGIEIVYLDTVRESSSRLLARWAAAAEANGKANGSAGSGDAIPIPGAPAAAAEALARFEDLVASQRSAPPERYDEEYFNEGWRDGGNDYTLEARRRIEGRHPELVREVFGAVRVLDMGCGPGALMELLREQGIDADGIDWSPRCRELAPASVRDRIHTGSLLSCDLPDRSYDLVLCPEVLEHMTILEIQRAVQNLCRISDRFVYLTTRFHPEPSSLLDVTDERHVDPTHITLLNQDLLRALIVLQGFRRRADLEARMDWLRKGRVLVYERADR
jgi:cytidyltransferase-like protein